jgi:hypothetical protein
MEMKEIEYIICIVGIIVIVMYAMVGSINENQIALVGLGLLGGYIGGKVSSSDVINV